MENIRNELSLEEMKTIDGAGLLDSVGHVLKTVGHEVVAETNQIKNRTKQVPAPRKTPSQPAKPAVENPVLSIFRNLTETMIKTF